MKFLMMQIIVQTGVENVKEKVFETKEKVKGTVEVVRFIVINTK